MRQRYHHFWASGPENADVHAWRVLVRDARKLFAAFPDGVVAENDNIIAEHVQTITFRGEGREDEWATFRLTSTPQSFACVTTNWEPFDLLVTAILLAARYRLGGWIKLTSDGRWADWDSARGACEDVLGYTSVAFEGAQRDFIELLEKEDPP